MITIIVCSVDEVKERNIRQHYAALLGDEEHEIIVFNDAASIAEAYNRGVSLSRGDVVIFSHDDIEFLDPGTWLARLKGHLNSFDVIGVAGTNKLCTPAWVEAGPPYTFGQVAELDGGQAGPYRALIFSAPSRAVSGIQAMDGLFIAVNRRVLEAIRFDDRVFDGFHGYDIDFTFSAFKRGFRLAVVTDLPVLHASQGNFDGTWPIYAQRLAEKHGAQFSPIVRRSFHHAVVWASSKAELLEIMAPESLR